MNKYLKFLAVCFVASAISAIMISCNGNDDPKEDDPIFEVAAGDKTQNFTYAADTRTISVNANREFTVTLNEQQTWCTAVRTEGNKVSVSVFENTGAQPRTTQVTLASQGLTSITITVNQTGTDPVFRVAQSDLTQEFTAEATDSRIVNVLTNREFTVNSSEAWCTAVRVENKVSISVPENDNAQARTAHVTLASEGLTSITITVNQSGNAPVFKVSTADLIQNFTDAGGSKTVSVTTNREFTVNSNEEWCVAIEENGNSVSITVSPNSEVDPRSATVTLVCVDMPDIEITVNQAGKPIEYGWWVETINDWNFGELSESSNCFSWDPKNPNHLYTVTRGGSLRLIDFGTNPPTMTTVLANNSVYNEIKFAGYNWITWTKSGDEMIVSTANGTNGAEGGAGNVNAMILTRANGFTDATDFLPVKKTYNASVAVHPVNGELYYSQWQGGTTCRYDLYTKEATELFQIGTEYNIIIHPTGNYAYFVDFGHAIYRANYNWTTKTFETPTLAFGEQGKTGHVNGVGTETRFYNLRQGVFVKNPEYAGQADEYDFYLSEEGNHCIRKISPEGTVSLFAGGSDGVAGAPKGTMDGIASEARFDCPQGLTYDEKNGCFYLAVQWRPTGWKLCKLYYLAPKE